MGHLSPTIRPQLGEAISKLKQVTLEGLQHGFFEICLRSEIVKGHKRRFTIVAGNSYQFTIPEQELLGQTNNGVATPEIGEICNVSTE